MAAELLTWLPNMSTATHPMILASAIQMPTHEWALLIAIPAAWIFLFLGYCVRVAIRGPYRVAALERRTTSAWLPRTLLEFGYWLYQTPVRLMAGLGITANMLTLASLVISLGAALLIAGGHFGIGGWVLLLAFTCDVWDGMVARLQGKSSRAGEFLDATIDRYGDLIAFCGFLYYYRAQPAALVLVMAALVGSTLVSYSRAKGEIHGVIAEVGYMRRYERAVWLGAGTVLAPLLAAVLEPGSAHPTYHLTLVVMALLALLANVTAIWRIVYILRALAG